MQKQTSTDLTENRIPANTSQDMLKRVFAVAELVAKGNGQEVLPDAQLQKQCEKTQK